MSPLSFFFFSFYIFPIPIQRIYLLFLYLSSGTIVVLERIYAF